MSAPPDKPVAEPLPPPPPKPPKKGPSKVMLIIGGVAALLVLVGGGFFVWSMFFNDPPPPPPRVAPKPKPAAPVPIAAVVPAAADATPAAASPTAPKPAAPLTPSDTLNAIASAPVNAINKAQGAVAARRDSGQTGIEAATGGQESVEKKNAPPAPGSAAAKAAAAANKPAVSASATLAPGISATASDVDAVAEATPAFRTFVANAKITGVIGGNPGKIILNNRMARAGDMIDPGLGVVFDSIDADRKLLVFKDKTGAVVTRKY